jgi:hypothetical protein
LDCLFKRLDTGDFNLSLFYKRLDFFLKIVLNSI